MKQTFSIKDDNTLDTMNLSVLESTLQNKEPYAVINVSTTGIDRGNSKIHEPIRVVVKEYEYDDTIKDYVERMSFDKQVKCSPEALQSAVDNLSSYDVFSNGGIDLEAYKRGENVYEKEDFVKQLGDFLKSFEDKDTLVIANGTDFAKKYLNKLSPTGKDSPALFFDKKEEQSRLLNQPDLTKEYLLYKNNTIPAKATLEELRNSLRNTADNEKIIGGDKRIGIISEFVSAYGREKGLIVSEKETKFRKADKERVQELSESGKEKYRNSDMEEKINTLLTKGVLTEDALDRNSNCDLNKFLNLVEHKTNAKGFTVLQVATTGFSANNEPMQVTAFTFSFKEGGTANLKPVCFTTDIQVSAKALEKAKADQEKADKGIKGAFPVFTDANTTPEKVQSGRTPDEALKFLKFFFEKYPPEQYPIISNGPSRANKNISFSQECLQKLGNLPAFNTGFIDMTQVFKEYSYRVMKDDKYDGNRLFGNATENIGFGLKDIASINNTDVSGTMNKVNFTSKLCIRIAQQNKELFPENYLEFIEKEPEQEAPVKEEKKEPEYQEEIPVIPEDEEGYANTIPPEILDEITDDRDYIRTPDTRIPEKTSFFVPEQKESIREPIRETIREVPREPVRETSRETTREPVRENVGRTPRFTERTERRQFPSPTPEDMANPRKYIERSSTELVAVLKEQTEFLKQQLAVEAQTHQQQIERLEMRIDAMQRVNEALLAQNAQYLQIIANQQAMMQNFMASKQEDLSKGTPLEKIDGIKEQISDVSKEVPASVSRTLTEANKVLSKGQRELDTERETEKKIS